MDDKIYLSPPSIQENEFEYVQKALQSNWLATTGTCINQFEEKLESYIGQNKKAVALNSGTSAIHLGLILLGVQKGDEVLVQSHTHIASVNPILYLGATPIFIDSEYETWNMCPKYLEQAIIDRIQKGKKPKVIIAVDLYGMPFKVDEIKSISIKYAIPILEDAAEALGSTYNNQFCGTFGDIGVFSFNGNKIITTSGGGALVVNNQELKEKAIFLASQAKEKASYFEHKEVGFNYRMTNIAASLGCAQLDRIDQIVAKRKENNQFYKRLFSEYNFKVLENSDYVISSNFWLSTVIMAYKKNIALQTWLDNHQIESRRLWKPMHLQPLFNEAIFYGTDISETLFNNGLCLPSGTNLSLENKKRIKVLISSFFNLKV